MENQWNDANIQLLFIWGLEIFEFKSREQNFPAKVSIWAQIIYTIFKKIKVAVTMATTQKTHIYADQRHLLSLFDY